MLTFDEVKKTILDILSEGDCAFPEFFKRIRVVYPDISTEMINNAILLLSDEVQSETTIVYKRIKRD